MNSRIRTLSSLCVLAIGGCATGTGMVAVEGSELPPAGPAIPDRATLAAQVQKQPQRADLWRDLGWTDFLDGDGVKARESFRKAAAIDPRDARTLLGLATIDHEAGRYHAARELWLAILETSDAGDPWTAAIVDTAAARLVALAGEVPGERDLAARLAKLEGRVGGEARARLFALRAHLARRVGDEGEGYRIDGLRACPKAWQTAGPFGRLPRVDLSRALPPDTAASLPGARLMPARGCSLAVEIRGGRAGVGYAETWLRTPTDGVVTATIATDQPWRLLVDGATTFSSIDTTRYLPRTRSIELPLSAGWHRVALKLATPGARVDVTAFFQSEMPLEFLDHPPPGPLAHGPPVVARVRPPAAPPSVRGRYQALADYLVAQAASRDGDADVGERIGARLVAAAPRFVPGVMLAAQLTAEDPSRPARFARDRTRRLLERALALDPTSARARYNLAMMDLQDDKAEKALARLDDKLKGKPAARAESVPSDGWRVTFLRYQALRARGWHHEAEQALAQARREDPEACPPLDAAVAVARDRFDVTRARALALELVQCQPTSSELAELYHEGGDSTRAAAEYHRLLRLDPTRESWRSGLADALLAGGEVRPAVTVLESLVADHPRDATYRRRLADALVATDDAKRARAVLVDGMSETPEAEDLHRALAALGEGNVMDPYRVEGAQIIADFLKSGHKYDSPAVILLDRTVTRAFSTGARLTLTHNIIRVQNKDGIDKWGEVTIPEGAAILTLRTVKADGTTREPEEIAEKQTVSVPDLEPGDYVEFEYVDRAPPPAAFPDGFLAERFYFQSYDAPLDRTEYVVVVPRGMAVAVDHRGAAPAAVRSQRRDHGVEVDVTTWSDKQKPQLLQEPQQTPFAEYVPSVRISSGVSFLAWREYLRDQSFLVQRANEELRALARRLTDQKGPAEKVKSIDDWVRHNIKHGGSLDESATSVLARGEGSRVILERALLTAAGIGTDLWLVRPVTSAALDGALPDLEGYDEALLGLRGVPGIAAVDPRFRHAPTGFIAPTLRHQKALIVDDAATPRFAELPGGSDGRVVEMDVQLDASGDAEIKVTEKITGWNAVEWREGLDKVASDRLRAEYEQRTLGFYFPGATLKELEIPPHDDDSAPFVVRYSFHAPRLARGQDKRLVLAAPFPLLLGRRFVGVARRTTPLRLTFAAPTTIRATYHLPEGARYGLAPPVALQNFGEFSQRLTGTKDGLLLETRSMIPVSRVEPPRYAEFAEFAETVDGAAARIAEILLK